MDLLENAARRFRRRRDADHGGRHGNGLDRRMARRGQRAPVWRCLRLTPVQPIVHRLRKPGPRAGLSSFPAPCREEDIMPSIIETTVYCLDELPDAGKEKARAWYRESGLDYEDRKSTRLNSSH